MKEISPWRIRRTVQPQEEVEPEFTSVASDDSVHLRDYWKILVKRRWLTVSVAIIIFLLGAYFSFTATKVYTATALLAIEPHAPRVTDISEIYPAAGGRADDYYQTQLVLLRSRALAGDVITDLGLESNSTFANARIITSDPHRRIRSWILGYLGRFTNYVAVFIAPADPKSKKIEAPVPQEDDGSDGDAPKGEVPSYLIGRYLSLLSVTPVRNTRLIQVAFTTPNPELSHVLANHHLVAFLRMTMRNRFQLTSDAREFLEKQSGELKRKLERSEAALHQFRQRHGVVSLERGENIIIDRLIDLNRRLTDARANRIDAESAHRLVQDKTYWDLSDLTKQGLVPQLRSNLTSLEAEKARLATIFKPDHPRIQELNQQIHDARVAVNTELANVVRAIESNYAAAKSREEALQAEADKQQQLAMHFKELGVDYTLLQEEVNINRALHESVLKRLNETHVSSNIALSNMQISEKAVMPLGPSGPNISINLLFFLVFGVVSGCGMAFVVEYFDSRVRTPEDVAHALGLSTLGAVPHLKFLKGRNNNQLHIDPPEPVSKYPGAVPTPRTVAKELIICHRPLSVLNEAYRIIRTGLLLSQAEKPPQVILLTSPAPGEGKTVTTLNLSIALAQDGYSTLVIDGDMRNGQCHNRLGLRNNRGLSNVLTAGLSLEQGIQTTSIAGLSLLSRGVLPPNPTELLGSAQMRRVLNELRRRFEFILIDSPPAVPISDAAVVSVISDGVLLVIDVGKTSTPSAQKAVERLDTVRAPLLGVILNGVNPNDPTYSFYRTYSAYYGSDVPNDGNGLGETKDDNTDQTQNIFRSEKARGFGEPERGQTIDHMDPDLTPNVEEVTPDSSSRSVTDQPDSAKLFPSNFGSSGGGPQWPEKDVLADVGENDLTKIVEALTDAIGPIAPLFVRENIAALGESRSAFPKKRLGELLSLIQSEITKDELARFQSSIPEEFRNLANQSK